eukprot:9340263-Alexandrium_andersonii.AAC.1
MAVDVAICAALYLIKYGRMLLTARLAPKSHALALAGAAVPCITTDSVSQALVRGVFLCPAV